jgi:hypothetical protein
LAAEVGFLVSLGVVMGLIGPYGTSVMPAASRILYWMLCIVAGGAVGVAVDELVGRRTSRLWSRIALTSALMTPAVALLVAAASAALEPAGLRPSLSIRFLGQVLIISGLLMTLRALLWRAPRTVVHTRTVIAPPMPEAEARFRRNLSSRHRAASLIAIQAEDHYLRVHTGEGEELVFMRFSDALDALSGAHGFQSHRSWWVAAGAIVSVRWRKGGGDIRLTGGLTAPVSRTHAATLKEAGWIVALG